MNYHQDVAAMAAQMAWLITSRASAQLDVVGMKVAAASRGQVLALARRVVTDAAPDPGARACSVSASRHSSSAMAAARVAPLVSTLEQHPIAALAAALRAHPDLPIGALGVELRTAATGAGPGARTWASIGDLAMHADHHWRTTTTGALTPEQRWSAIADAAALAQAVTLLDAHLHVRATVLPGVGEPLARALAATTASGLRTTAAMAQAVAATGELPAYATTTTPPAPTTMLQPRSPADLPRAQARLTAQIRAADHLAPGAVLIIATTQATIARTAAVLLRQVDPTRSRFAAALTVGIEQVSAGAHHLAAATPGNSAPPAQAGAITAYLTATRQSWRAEAASVAPALSSALDASPAVLSALADHASRALATGAWLTAGHEADEVGAYPWRTLRADEARPPMLTALESITARSSAALLRATTTRSRGQVLAKPAREVLATVNTLTTARRPRVPTTATTHPGAEIGR